MTRRLTAAVFLALCVTAVSAEALKSGLQVGEKIPGPFSPMLVTGTHAGQKRSLVARHGTHPVAMVFARDVSAPLLRLIKKLDEATAAHAADEMGSFVVFCNEDEPLEAKLRELAEKEKLKNIVLCIDGVAGPERYKIARDADVTVVLYVKHKVEVNRAFRKGELTEKDAEKIAADVAKIIPAK
jgi:hypothetical protein